MPKRASIEFISCSQPDGAGLRFGGEPYGMPLRTLISPLSCFKRHGLHDRAHSRYLKRRADLSAELPLFLLCLPLCSARAPFPAHQEIIRPTRQLLHLLQDVGAQVFSDEPCQAVFVGLQR